MDSLSSVLPDGVVEAHLDTMNGIRASGSSIIDGKTFVELLGFTTGMAKPRNRIIVSDKKPWNVVVAVARFTWLIAGSDRLEDIAYYEDRVREYSDDQIVVPGSSYGRRIFSATPGLNQIEGVVSELRKNSHTRRAAAVVWLPEDAVRQSLDIPCTFGLFFHIRSGALTMTTVMRSNNAFTLLPYNFFEFSMLGEMVAAEIGVPFGRYVHWAASMHLFDTQSKAIDAVVADTTRRSVEMPEMPAGDALEQGRELARREAELRHAATKDQVFTVLEAARTTLNAYWLDLFHVLFAFGLAKRGLPDEAFAICGELPQHFAAGTVAQVELVLAQTAPSADDDGLFGLGSLERNPMSKRAALISNAVGADDEGSILWVARELDRLSQSNEPATAGELLRVMEELRPAKGEVALAARGRQVSIVTREDVAQALAVIRGRG